MGKKEATIKEVAARAGVSIATVSRVLNRNPKVNAEMTSRVQIAVRELGFVPNSAGRALRTHKTHTWGVLIPEVRDPFFADVLSGIEVAAAAAGYRVVLCNTGEKPAAEEKILRDLVGRGIDGVVLVAAEEQCQAISIPLGAGVPVVTVDRKVAGFVGVQLASDHYLIGAMAAEHLYEAGVRHPVCVRERRFCITTADRERGFWGRFAELMGVEVPARCVYVDLAAYSHPLYGDPAEVPAGWKVDGVFAVNSPTGARAFNGLRAAGAEMPGQIKLVVVDDSDWAQLVSPSVTVIDQQPRRLGQLAAQALLGSSSAVGDLWSPVLHPRESTQDCK